MVDVTLTKEKRRRALLLLRNGNVSRLGPEAALIYTVGLVIADEDGIVRKPDVDRALEDPAIVATARELLRRARA